MTRISLALLAAIFPAASSAQCPTSETLATGIVFTGEHGEHEVFTDVGDDMVRAVYETQDGYSAEALLARGAFLIELRDLVGTEEESLTSYEYPLENSGFKAPEAGGSWDITVSVSDGQNNVFERQIYTYGAAEEQSYGDCVYEVIPFTAEYSTAPEVVETYHYLPALGLSYLYAYVDPTGASTYPYTAIQALP